MVVINLQRLIFGLKLIVIPFNTRKFENKSEADI